MSGDRPVFYFQLDSPHAWLAAEQVNGLFEVPPVWQPILLAASVEPKAGERAGVERRAAELGLMPVRWPQPRPRDLDAAMRAATFAKQTGRAVAFALAAFRQAFNAGRDLGDVDNVLIAAAACELHPRAVLAGIETRAVEEELRRATDEAAARGVQRVPALVLGDELFEGEDRLGEAATRVDARRVR